MPTTVFCGSSDRVLNVAVTTGTARYKPSRRTRFIDLPHNNIYLFIVLWFDEIRLNAAADIEIVFV